MKIFDQEYSDESFCQDLDDDITYLLDTADIPKDEYGFRKGTFRVTIEWMPEEPEKPVHTCSVCGTTKNVRWVGGSIPWLCDSPDCIPF